MAPPSNPRRAVTPAGERPTVLSSLRERLPDTSALRDRLPDTSTLSSALSRVTISRGLPRRNSLTSLPSMRLSSPTSSRNDSPDSIELDADQGSSSGLQRNLSARVSRLREAPARAVAAARRLQESQSRAQTAVRMREFRRRMGNRKAKDKTSKNDSDEDSDSEAGGDQIGSDNRASDRNNTANENDRSIDSNGDPVTHYNAFHHNDTNNRDSHRRSTNTRDSHHSSTNNRDSHHSSTSKRDSHHTNTNNDDNHHNDDALSAADSESVYSQSDSDSILLSHRSLRHVVTPYTFMAPEVRRSQLGHPALAPVFSDVADVCSLLGRLSRVSPEWVNPGLVRLPSMLGGFDFVVTNWQGYEYLGLTPPDPVTLPSSSPNNFFPPGLGTLPLSYSATERLGRALLRLAFVLACRARFHELSSAFATLTTLLGGPPSVTTAFDVEANEWRHRTAGEMNDALILAYGYASHLSEEVKADAPLGGHILKGRALDTAVEKGRRDATTIAAGTVDHVVGHPWKTWHGLFVVEDVADDLARVEVYFVDGDWRSRIWEQEEWVPAVWDARDGWVVKRPRSSRRTSRRKSGEE